MGGRILAAGGFRSTKTWRLEERLPIIGPESRQRLQKTSSRRSVKNAVVERQAHGHDSASERYVCCRGVRLNMNTAEAEDGCLWEVDDWCESIDVQRAEIRDCECATLQVLSRQSPSTSLLDQLTRLLSDVEDRLAVRVSHDGNQQPLSGIDSNADVNLIEDFDDIVLPARIEQRMFSQSQRREFDEAVGDGWDQRCTGAFELFAKLDDRGHVDLGSERDRGGLLEAGDHAIGDRAP